jgi:hypothetical protein
VQMIRFMAWRISSGLPGPSPPCAPSTEQSPAEAGLDGVPNHSELEPIGGVSHGLGWAPEVGGVTLRSVSAAAALPS